MMKFRGAKGRLVTIHRLVAEAFLPVSPERRCVNHKNGNKTDNRVCNLEWVTHGENLRHAFQHGLRPRRANTRPCLDAAQIGAIRELRLKGLALHKIAAAVGCSVGTAHKYQGGGH